MYHTPYISLLLHSRHQQRGIGCNKDHSKICTVPLPIVHD